MSKGNTKRTVTETLKEAETAGDNKRGMLGITSHLAPGDDLTEGWGMAMGGGGCTGLSCGRLVACYVLANGMDITDVGV